LFQRHTQLCMARYFNEASVHGAQATLPRINGLLDIIQFRNWQSLPQLPPRYTNTLGPGGPGPSRPTPSGGRGGPGSPGVDTPTQGTRCVNVSPNSVLMARFAQTPKRLGDLSRNAALIPRGDNGTEVLCLSHILRGECNTACRRASTHRALTQTEQSRVGEFLTQSGVE
jgi:hypothetical protein